MNRVPGAFDEAAVAERYVAFLGDRGVDLKERQEVRGTIRLLRNFLAGRARRLVTTREDDVHAFRSWLETDYRPFRGPRVGRAGTPPAMLRVRMRRVLRFFEWLTAGGFVDANPAAAVVVNHSCRDAKTRSRLLAAADSSTRMGLRDRCLTELLVAGLHPIEIVRLDLDAVAEDLSSVTAGRRRVALNPSARRALGRYVARVRPIRVKDSTERALLVTERRGRRIARETVDSITRRLAIVAGLRRRPAIRRAA